MKLNKEEQKRQDCIKELIVTEQAYIDDMTMIHDVRMFITILFCIWSN